MFGVFCVCGVLSLVIMLAWHGKVALGMLERGIVVLLWPIILFAYALPMISKAFEKDDISRK